MFILYNPLEQFEPVPFISLFISNVNFSITSISIMSIYIIFIAVFFLNGYIFEPASSGNLNISQDKDKSLAIKTTSDFAMSPETSALTASLKKEVSYFSFLIERSVPHYFLLNEKATWVSSPLSFSSLRNRYSVIFYKGYYSLLSEKAVTFSSIQYFNNIKAIVSDFLISYTGTVSKLNKNFDVVKSQQSLHSLTTSISRDTYQPTFVPKANLFLFESIYALVLDGLVKTTIGPDRRSLSFFPIVFTLFLFLLIGNVSGLVPYGSTVTAYLIITLTLSTMVMFAVTAYAFKLHGIRFFGHFLPSGTPSWLMPLIIPVEVLSYVFRVISLSVRLFANMMAGHTLFAVIAGFGWAMATGSAMISVVSPIPMLVVFILVGLETFVALIQAYVFTILTCLYIEELINIH